MGGAAGGVHLPVMVDFHNLNVRVRETGCRLLCQTAQHRNAKAHVAGVENGNFFGSVENQLPLFGGVAGGPDDGGAAVGLCIAENVRRGGVMGKVDDHVGGDRAKLIKGSGHAVFTVDADPANHLAAQTLGNQFPHGAVGAAEDRSHTFTPSARSSANMALRSGSSMGVSGRRRCSSPKPMADTAALTGMGLT